MIMIGKNWVEDVSLARSKVEALAKGLSEEYRLKIICQMSVILDYVRMNSIPQSVAVDSQGGITFDFTDITGMPLERIVEAVDMARSKGGRLSNNPIYNNHLDNGNKIHNW